jgi:hypothetical protein
MPLTTDGRRASSCSRLAEPTDYRNCCEATRRPTQRSTQLWRMQGCCLKRLNPTDKAAIVRSVYGFNWVQLVPQHEFLRCTGQG